jgi:hypothetical protein
MPDNNPTSPQLPSEPLGTLDIEVFSGLGAERFDPTSIIMSAFAGYLSQLPEVPRLLSQISNGPAIIYRTQEVTLYLTPGELHRIVMRSLTPDEMFALRAKHGDFFEIHADFYDPVSGAASQPKE